MKIALLLEREPFPKILEETLSRFLESTTGNRHSVQWIEGLPDKHGRAESSAGIWLCNPRINALYSTEATLGVFEIPWREYLRGPTLLHTIGHAGYLLAATLPIGRSRIPTHHVRIDPQIGRAESILILGGNTRLRWVDFGEGKVTTILKEGFDPELIRREIEVRNGRDDLLAPPILEQIDDGRAFTEPLIRGTVVDRLFSKKRAEAAIAEAVEATSRLASKSRHVVSWMDWWPTLREKCAVAAGRIAGKDHSLVQRALELVDEIGVMVSGRIDSESDGVEVTLSHGDLQPGNVLVEGDRTWLIDWERVDDRASGYDILTLVLGSRRSARGLIERAGRLFDATASNRFDKLASAAVLLSAGADRATVRLLIYWLEEIRFHLEESGVGPLYGPSGSLEELVRELGNLGQSELLSN